MQGGSFPTEGSKCVAWFVDAIVFFCDLHLLKVTFTQMWEILTTTRQLSNYLCTLQGRFLFSFLFCTVVCNQHPLLSTVGIISFTHAPTQTHKVLSNLQAKRVKRHLWHYTNQNKPTQQRDPVRQVTCEQNKNTNSMDSCDTQQG